MIEREPYNDFGGMRVRALPPDPARLRQIAAQTQRGRSTNADC